MPMYEHDQPEENSERDLLAELLERHAPFAALAHAVHTGAGPVHLDRELAGAITAFHSDLRECMRRVRMG